MKLIVPMGGLSTRYGVGRPKWMLTHPDGKYMIEKAIECLPLEKFEEIHLILTEQVLSEFKFNVETVRRAIEEIPAKTLIFTLSGRSSCQLETVARHLRDCRIDGPVMVKDCDNAFSVQDGWDKQGVLSKKVLPGDDVRRLQQKCFVKLDYGRYVQELAEKNPVSDSFAVGGYVFSEAARIVEAFDMLTNRGVELYMSHAVNWLIKMGGSFRNSPVTDYEDWGTLREWKDYCATFVNLIIDIDGVLFENGSRAMYPRWGDQMPLYPNVEAVRDLQRGGRARVIFATARPESWREVTKRQLEALGLDLGAGLVMGLFHAKRVLVNDFGGPTSPYPSAEGWSVLRNSDQLAEILAGQMRNSK